MSFMSGSENLTSVMIEENQEETGKNYWAVILLVLCVFVVFGNVLVILSVAKERLLQNMTNFFIVSLAIADLLVAGFVMPFSVYVLVNWGMWGLPKVVCDFYIASDVICSTSSIFNLVAVSVDRYYAVTAPITYSQHKDKHGRVYAFIIFCWLASIAIGSPIMLGANHIPDVDDFNATYLNASSSLVDYGNDTEEFVCAFYNPDFIIYSSLGSFYIPCFVMIFLYGRIFKTLHQRAKKARRSKQKLPLPSNTQLKDLSKPSQGPKSSVKRHLAVTSSNGGATSKLVTDAQLQEESFCNQCETQIPKIEIRVECSSLNNCSNLQQQKTSIDDSQRNLSSPPPKPNMAHKACGPDTSLYDRVKTSRKETGENDVKCSLKPKQTQETIPEISVSQVSPQGDADITTEASLSIGRDESKKRHSFQGFAENILRFRQRVSRKRKKNKSKEKLAARKERKATKTLAIVLGCFLICWTPFFTCNIINAICIKLESSWHPGDTAFLVTTWLGYINSCINPVIYTIFNPEFRKAFKKILGLGH